MRDFAGAHPGYKFWVYRPNAALARARTAAGMLSVCATRRSSCSPGSGSRSTFRRWISATKSGSFILDNLLAQGKVKPMIVVMTDGHAYIPHLGGGATPNLTSRNVEDFGRDL